MDACGQPSLEDKTEKTYLVIDGENIDTTLGLSVLERRPNSEERPRWDRVIQAASNLWGQPASGLFFLNGSSGFLPMGFVQALTAMNYRAIPLSGPEEIKVVDVGIQRTLEAIGQLESGSVILASHDGDFVPQLEELLHSGRRVAVMGFKEFISSHLQDLQEEGLEILDLEYDVEAFQVHLPRLKIIDVDDFDPFDFL
ncbi:NYN domain-containing protein [Schaalia sp. lx-260]|uniref:NYN domain-containing protein n=1 Tax=Schaalia sp. lx-260 TaxID=2899082 RepID=UPI001E299AF4|nr:NYN domain-containing protein [Schaalia sp. lx-260]MCD4548991.1 NYN domain-containing protein [Schaalia sp. lx-260]